MNKDGNAAYEAAANISGQTLAAVLKGVDIKTAEFSGELTEAGGDELSTLYVTIKAVNPIP